MGESVMQVSEDFKLRVELAELKALKDAEREAKAAYDELNEKRKKKEYELYNIMVDQQIKSLKIEGVGNFITQATVTGYIESDKMEDFIAWCKKTGNEEVFLQIKHRGQPLNEMVRDCLADGRDLPPGVAPKETPYISIRKA